jgi:hypothetical protein
LCARQPGLETAKVPATPGEENPGLAMILPVRGLTKRLTEGLSVSVGCFVSAGCPEYRWWPLSSPLRVGSYNPEMSP